MSPAHPPARRSSRDDSAEDLYADVDNDSHGTANSGATANSDRTTVYNALLEAGQKDLAELIRRM